MVWLGVRDLAFSPIGRHLFILLETGELSLGKLGLRQRIWRTAIGGGRIGLTLGATNVDGRLRVRINESYDLAAARRILRGWRPGEAFTHRELRVIDHADSETAFVARLLRLASNYVINEEQQHVRYPWLGWGVNSNAWTRQIVQAAGGIVDPNMPGFDVHLRKRLPRIYFQAICPAQPRPVVNP